MKFVATIEARMTSTRLPGKCLLMVKKKSMLEHLVNRLKTTKYIDKIVLATTTKATDDILIEEAKKLNIAFFRGSENNVMDRVIKAAKSVKADVVVEITGDCPIIDPDLIDQAIMIFKQNNVDYVSNCNIRSYPDGMDIQVFKLKTLIKSASMTKDALDQEHVTLHIKKNPKIFKHLNIISPPSTYWPELGLTLDEKSDFILLKKIIEYFYKKNPYFSCLDVIDFLRKNKSLLKINKDVLRKGNT